MPSIHHSPFTIRHLPFTIHLVYSYFFKIASRNLARHPLYTGINLVSLSIGMAAALLIGLWVQNELRYDRYHRRAEQVWRITTDLKIGDNEHWYWGTTPLKIAELAEQVPGIVQSAQVKSAAQREMVLWHGPMQFLEKNPAWVSKDWFKTFDFQLKEGSLDAFFERTNSILLSERKAKQIFGDHVAVGQELRIDSTNYLVCGVLKDPLPQSTFQYELWLPVNALLTDPKERENENSWGNFNYNTFVELHPSADVQAVSNQLTELLRKAKGDSSIVMGLQPLADLHFDVHYQDEYKKGSKTTVGIFAMIALLLLGMACINYVGLTTARAASRAREIGIKKINGAHNRHVFAQVMAESALMIGMAALLGVGLVQLVLPFFNAFTEQNFRFGWADGVSLYLVGGASLVALLFSGAYPAWLLSGFRPMSVLRGQAPVLSGRSPFRRGLVVLQFAVAVALLAATVVIGEQRRYIDTMPLGYDRNQVFEFNISWQVWRKMGVERVSSIRDVMARALSAETAVAGVSLGSQSPVLIESTHSGSVKYDGMPDGSEPTVSQLNADAEYGALFGLNMSEGRWFERDSKADEANVVLNETAARTLNLPKPWVGQRFEFHGKKGQVVGVARDFHFMSLHDKITPLVVFNDPSWRFRFFVKARQGAEKQAIAAAEKIWKTHFPAHPFQYKTLDDNFEQLYGTERRAGTLANLFTGVAILIACMGLFGLAVFVSGQRTKEVGVRKVLGGSVVGIAALLAKDFLKLVCLSLLFAIPAAYYFVRHWLSDFAYRIELQWWMFAAASIAALVIATITVGFQAIKTAASNPVKSLRSE